MPYIPKEEREILDRGFQPETPGQLNYAISAMLKRYLELNGNRYQTINDILGALEGAKLEFYRRVASHYEDEKIQSNGDVY